MSHLFILGRLYKW